MSATGIILAGGRSRRMGRDKALLRIEGETLLERTVRVTRALADEVIVVGRPRLEGPGGVLRLEDERPDSGPLGGLYTGLRHASNAVTIVVACDLPNVETAVLRRL